LDEDGISAAPDVKDGRVSGVFLWRLGLLSFSPGVLVIIFTPARTQAWRRIFFFTSNFSETTSTTSQHFSGAFLKYSRQASKIQSSVEAHGDEIGFLNFECCPGVLKLGS
jgi:hypothetical protein